MDYLFFPLLKILTYVCIVKTSEKSGVTVLVGGFRVKVTMLTLI